jgi:tripartite-type tricarboxylate transporter receptor subunit TctC
MNASSSNGSPGHVGGELFKYMTATEIVHVPYKGGAMAINDLIAGHVQVMWESLNSISPHARSGKVKALAVSGSRRSPGFPDLPTIAEAGVPGYDLAGWYGVVVPVATPRPIVDRLHAEFSKAMRAPDIADRYATLGVEPVESTPEQFAAYMRTELVKWGDIVKRSGTKLE